MYSVAMELLYWRARDKKTVTFNSIRYSSLVGDLKQINMMKPFRDAQAHAHSAPLACLIHLRIICSSRKLRAIFARTFLLPPLLEHVRSTTSINKLWARIWMLFIRRQRHIRAIRWHKHTHELNPFERNRIDIGILLNSLLFRILQCTKLFSHEFRKRMLIFQPLQIALLL